MQLLTFSVAGQTYAIPSRQVVEVLPLVTARPVPHTPDFVRGIFTYRGALVPLVDLGLRLTGRPLEERLSTRVIVVAPAGPEPVTGPPARLGVVAENVITIRAAEDADASLPPLHLPAAPYLGQVFRYGGETVQLIDVDRLLPADLVAALRPAAAAGGAS
jgi:chemotaxis-related protein WspB